MNQRPTALSKPVAKAIACVHVRCFVAPVAALAFALTCESPPNKAAEQQQQAAVTDKPASSEAASKPACQAELLRAELDSFCNLDIGVPPIELPKVGWTAAPYHPLATRVITLDRGGVTDPEQAGTVSIAQWLADPPRRIPEPGELVFAIAAEVPATMVAELQAGLAAAGRKRVRYLVHIADARPIPQPRDGEMLTQMREALPANVGDRMVFVASAVQGYGETCPPVAGVFPKLVQVGSGDRCSKLAELASQAIVECGCAELDRIMTLLYALTVGFEVPLGRAAAVEVSLDPATPLDTPAEATWGQLAPTLFASAPKG